MDIVKKNNIVNNAFIITQIIQKIVDHVSLINDFQLRTEIELTNYICNLVENEINKQKTNKIDKKELVLMIFIKLYNLNDDEKTLVSKQIDFLFNNKLIKKIPVIEKVFKNFGLWIVKRLS